MVLVLDEFCQVHERLIATIPQILVLSSIDVPHHKTHHLDHTLEFLIKVALYEHGHVVIKLGICVNVIDRIQCLHASLRCGFVLENVDQELADDLYNASLVSKVNE